MAHRRSETASVFPETPGVVVSMRYRVEVALFIVEQAAEHRLICERIILVIWGNLPDLSEIVDSRQLWGNKW
jgi:hypothetical protein